MSDEEEAVVGEEYDRAGLREFLALGGAPAFMVRERRVREAFAALVQKLEWQRRQWLEITRLRAGTLRALAGDWSALLPLVRDEHQLTVLEELHRRLDPQLRLPPDRTGSMKVLRRALAELVESVEFFNRRWRKHVAEVDLTELNRLRDNFNKYYLLEKECVIGSPVLARRGFEKMPPARPEELLEVLPPLPVPAVKR